MLRRCSQNGACVHAATRDVGDSTPTPHNATHSSMHTPSTLQCLAAYMLSYSCPLPIHAHTHTHKKCRTTLSRTVRLVLRLRDTVDTMLSGGGSPKRLNETDQEHFTDTGRRDDVQKIFPLSTFRCVAFCLHVFLSIFTRRNAWKDRVYRASRCTHSTARADTCIVCFCVRAVTRSLAALVVDQVSGAGPDGRVAHGAACQHRAQPATPRHVPCLRKATRQRHRWRQVRQALRPAVGVSLN